MATADGFFFPPPFAFPSRFCLFCFFFSFCFGALFLAFCFGALTLLRFGFSRSTFLAAGAATAQRGDGTKAKLSTSGGAAVPAEGWEGAH